MTRIQITVEKPDLTDGLDKTPVYKAMKAIPTYNTGKILKGKYRPGAGIETRTFLDGDNYIVELKGQNVGMAYDAAQAFIDALDQNIILDAVAITGKRITNLLNDE